MISILNDLECDEFDGIFNKEHFLNEHRSRNAAAKKVNTSGVGISNIMRKSIYLLTTPTNHAYIYYYILTTPIDSTH